jgi:methylglutaconyl-CoA hydratase
MMISLHSTLESSLDARGVFTLTLNRPQVRNAFNADMIDDLLHVFTTEVVKKEIRLVVLQGAGSAFCAGGDLSWMKRSIDYSYEENLAETRKLVKMFAAMNECPKPLIGVVHGAAIGGGVGLVSVCDIVLAVADTQLSLSEVRLGIVPACIGPFVVSKIGASHARGLFMGAERFTAQKGKDIGLIHEVVATTTELKHLLEQTLERMLQCGPHAMAAAKKLVLDLTWPERRSRCEDCYESVAQILADLRVSPEGQEGLRAFLEKRKPNWLSQNV